MVSVFALENETFVVKCDFITGSDARGCMVVLSGEFENITINLTRNNPCTTISVTLNAAQQLYCNLAEVFGYDIESDGSVGSLPLPGTISINVSQSLTCTPIEIKTPSGKLRYNIIIIIILK